MHEEYSIRIHRKSWEVLWILIWGCIWFLGINAAVWCAFDRHFFDWVGFDRLLMQPSDNELQGVMSKIKNETDKKHIVLLGDSIVWGIGVNDPKETLSGQLSQLFKERGDIRVVNLAVPGNSFLDMAAQVRSGYNPNDIYVFFVNSMLFDEEFAKSSFEDMVRFKGTVTDMFAADPQRFGGCCDLKIPKQTLRSVLAGFFADIVPVYRHRDQITKMMIGLQPSIAVNAMLHRVLSGRLAELLERRPMSIGSDHIVLKQTQDFAKSRMTKVLSAVSESLNGYPNIFYVILDDNRFEKNLTQDRNVTVLQQAMASKQILTLYKSIGPDLYLDTVHMTPDGHRKVAEKLFEFLSESHAI